MIWGSSAQLNILHFKSVNVESADTLALCQSKAMLPKLLLTVLNGKNKVIEDLL